MKKIPSFLCFFALLCCAVFSHAQLDYLSTDNDHLPAGVRERADQIGQTSRSLPPQQPIAAPIRVDPPQQPAAAPVAPPLSDPSYAQHLSKEKFLLFDTQITILPDAKITVTENITVNVRHEKIRRGLYRDIPVSWNEKVTPVSLTMDNQAHPFFTEHKSGALRINFGNDHYISQGIHTYSLTYTFDGAIDFYKNHDELYWNVTGNDWDFPIDKARVSVTLPQGVSVQQNGISLYTGQRGSNKHNARQIGPLAFETTAPLSSNEGLTIAIPFDKGFFVEPSFAKRLFTSFSWAVWFFASVFIALIVYFAITWIKVGRDPVSLAITRYEPPQGLSPAFVQYLHDRGATHKTLACVLVSLAMKGYIEIKPQKGFFSSNQADVIRTDKKREKLPKDEALVMHYLFPLGNRVFQLKSTAAAELNSIFTALKKYFEDASKEYIVTNSSYLYMAAGLVFILGVLPAVVFWYPPLLFINAHFSVFFLASTLPIRRIAWKIGVGLFFTLFYSPFFFLSGGCSLPATICEALFLLSMWGISFYHLLIQNVTPAGQAVLSQIAGFEKYMKTAEPNRFAASDPRDTQRIFCDYLPFAFALGMENKWMKKFESTLSKAVIERCTACVGGTRFVSSALASSVSRSGGGGSHGGGCSGGGHGGGGGGGR